MVRARQRRRAMSMTSLVDVIFLLLLFFMLTSTFSHFAEVELRAPGAGQGTTAAPLFLQLFEASVALNGETLALDALAAVMRRDGAGPVIVSVQDGVTAQRLTDLLVVLRGVPEAQVSLLGEG